MKYCWREQKQRKRLFFSEIYCVNFFFFSFFVVVARSSMCVLSTIWMCVSSGISSRTYGMCFHLCTSVCVCVYELFCTYIFGVKARTKTERTKWILDHTHTYLHARTHTHISLNSYTYKKRQRERGRDGKGKEYVVKCLITHWLNYEFSSENCLATERKKDLKVFSRPYTCTLCI